jgi:hypothetical protein
MSMKRKNSSLVSIDSTCTLMPVRVEKSDWERVSPVMVGTGGGCVSDEMSEEVKGEGPKDVLPMDKASRDAASAGRQHCMNSKWLSIVEKRFKAGWYGSPITDMETSWLFQFSENPGIILEIRVGYSNVYFF